MPESFAGWWDRKYKDKNTHLMITKDIARAAYNAGNQRGKKLAQKKNDRLIVAEMEAEIYELRKAGLDRVERNHEEQQLLIARAERAEAWVMEGGARATIECMRAEYGECIRFLVNQLSALNYAPKCTCGMDDNMHESDCAIVEWEKAKRE